MLQTIILGVLVPALCAGAGALVLRGFADSPEAGLRRGGALGLAVGFALAHWLILGWPPFPPADSTRWLPYLAIAAGLLGLVEAGRKVPDAGLWLLRAILALGVVWLVGKPIFQNQMEGATPVLWLLGLTAALLALWGELEFYASRSPGLLVPLALTVTATATSIALAVSFTASLGQLAGSVAAGAGALAVTSLIAPKLSMARGPNAVFIALLGGLWIGGNFYASLPLYAIALLWLSPTGLAVAEVGRLKTMGNTARAVMAIVVVLALAGLAVYLAHQANAISGEYPY